MPILKLVNISIQNQADRNGLQYRLPAILGPVHIVLHSFQVPDTTSQVDGSTGVGLRPDFVVGIIVLLFITVHKKGIQERRCLASLSQI